MVEEYWNALKKEENIRENLSLLRQSIKEPKEREKLLSLADAGILPLECLNHEDPKVRKNAVLLLGDMGKKEVTGQIFRAYSKEETLFVKSSYLTALRKLGAEAYLEELKLRRDMLAEETPALEERKHKQEELRELDKIITELEGVKKHRWKDFEQEHTFLLTAEREQREVILSELATLSPSVEYQAKKHPLGILITAKKAAPFLRLRTYRELLFPLCMQEKTIREEEQAAEAVWRSKLLSLLLESHEQEAPFYFRVELRSRMELSKKGSFTKRFSAALERLSGRQLINSTSAYEVELRLIETKTGAFAVFAKLFTVPMKRFSYRKHAISASIHPSMAAILMEVARPYLKENAQILDPFCGVGTMLIERDMKVPAREKYGIDSFGDAIRMARENAAAAGEQIHFINRDYFDFRHDYLFDELITNMPTRGKQTKEEMDAFYTSFFKKSKTLLVSGGRMIFYSNEEGFVKKQLRLNPDYHLLYERCMREKEQYKLYVVEYRG